MAARVVWIFMTFMLATPLFAAELEEQSSKKSELLLRIGNESNPVDGLWGPFTYGARGEHSLRNGMHIEAAYIRLHEPNTPWRNSVVDEAAVSVRSSEHHGFTYGGTAWQNRMVDMYTNLAGFEVTREGDLSVLLGAYLGSATRENSFGNFQGGQVAVSTGLGPVELGLGVLFGKIDAGNYRKTALESSWTLPRVGHFPLVFTFDIEERYFDFGNNGPKSEPKDEFIFVSGIEIHLEDLF